MPSPRLYDAPEVTRKVLRLVIKGSDDREKLAEELGCSPRTVYNKVHDPKALGFLEREDGKYVISDKKELMKLFQLDQRDVLKRRFKSMPGVEEINDELIGGSLTFVRVGRIVAYYTDSEAIDESAFRTYGRIYSRWFDYLGMGYASNQKLTRDKPPDYNVKQSRRKDGDGRPSVRPEAFFEAMAEIHSGADDKDELKTRCNYSDSKLGKVLATCSVLGAITRSDGIELTDFGEKIINADENKQRKYVRDALLELDLIETYCDIAPNKPFKNQEVMRKVGEKLNKGWSKTTSKTNAKRLYQWFIYSELFVEVKRGFLAPASYSDDSNLSSIEDYV